MGKKPKLEVRKPPADEPDPDETESFIEGGDVETSSNSDVQTSEPKRVQTTVYLDAELKHELKIHCATEEVEMSATVNAAVAAYLGFDL